MPPADYWTVIPAAGQSSRFGSPKALMDVGGRTAVEAIVDTAVAAGSSGVVVVVRGDPPDLHQAVAQALQTDKARRSSRSPAAEVKVLLNRAPGRGMISTVRIGVSEVPRGSAVMVWPVDHPFVSVETVRALAGPGVATIAVPMHDGRGGHPTCFPPSLVPAILALDDSGGLNRILRSGREVAQIEVEDPGVILDIDRRADLARGLAMVRESSARSWPRRDNSLDRD